MDRTQESTSPSHSHEAGVAMAAAAMAARPRRMSNLGIDFLDDPDMRPGKESSSYYGMHAESFHGDKEHRQEDLMRPKQM